MDEFERLAEGSVATSPDGSTVGGPAGGSALGVDLDYVGMLTAKQCVDLFRLAGLLRAVLKRQGVSSMEAKRRAKWDRLGALLALTEARRPTLATLERFAVGMDVPADILRDIVAVCPCAISSGKKDI